MNPPPSPSNGNGAPPDPESRDRWRLESGGTANEDAATLRRIVLFLVLCGLVGFTLLIVSIAVDWNSERVPPRTAPRD